MGNSMKKTYALKDDDGKLIATIHTSEEMETPWFLLTQDSVSSEMVWDEDQQKFILPS